MKFLHIADLHLDSPLRTQAARDPVLGARLRSASRQVLSRAVDAALSHDVDAMLFAGDTFDRDVADVASRAALATEVARLKRAGIPAILIQGNHDALLDLDRYGPVSDALTVLTPDNPTVRIAEASIHGIGFTAPHMAESLLPRYPRPEPGRINLGLMHTSLDGAQGHDPYAPCALSDLLGHGYDYWALGHIHKRAVYEEGGRAAVMAGIPQGRSIRETEGGSATLVEIGQDGVGLSEIALDLLRFDTVAVDFSDVSDQAGRDERLRSVLQTKCDPARLVAARLILSGTPAELGDPAMLDAQARAVAETIDGIFIDKLRLRPAHPIPDDDAARDLVAMMREDAKSAGFRDEVRAALAEMQAALPPDIRDVLDPDDIKTLIEAGIDDMALRLAPGRETP